MSFVSYAQNLEDVMLWRALKHVGQGFYIDVGANDPVVDSVTKAFYDRGWRGINIEPLSSHHAALLIDRPRDINLQCAAGATSGELEIWECDVRGWATASMEAVERHIANGHEGAFHKVPVVQLKDVCGQHVPGEIHFLKIDVEGFEKSVIDGMDFFRFRPWVLVIEATRPNSTEEVHGEWEAQVVSAGYGLAYVDGLNRFYVANERAELLAAFRYPPNVFDAFVRADQLVWQRRAERAETQSDKVAHQLAVVYDSLSWRITGPLRWIGGWLMQPWRGIRSWVARTATRFLRPLIQVVLNSERVSANLNRLIVRMPTIHRWLKAIHGPGASTSQTSLPALNAKQLLNRLIRWSMGKPTFVAVVHAVLARTPGPRAVLTRHVATAMTASDALAVSGGQDSGSTSIALNGVGLHRLTPHGRHMYGRLKAAIGKQAKEIKPCES